MLKRKFKKIGAILSCTALLCTSFVNVFADNILSDFKTDNCIIEIIADGADIQLENKPFTENGEVYLPLRELVNLIDDTAAVDWDNGKVSVITDDNAYLLTIGAAEVSVNPLKSEDATYTKSAKNTAVIKNDRTFVPYDMLKFITDNYEKNINYAVYDDINQYEKAVIWANSLKTRDGKPRYDIMTADMQNKFIENQKEYIGGEDWNYVIGYSSPWTVSYNIVSLDNKAQITYYQTDSAKEKYVVIENIVFENISDVLYVSGSETDYSADTE